MVTSLFLSYKRGDLASSNYLKLNLGKHVILFVLKTKFSCRWIVSIWYLSLQWGKQIFLVPWLISWFSLWHVPIYQVCGGLKCDNNMINELSSSWKDPGSTTKFLKMSVPFNLANSSTLLPWNRCPNYFHLLVALQLEQLAELRMSISVENSGP